MARMTTAAQTVADAVAHLRSPGPLNTCVSNGIHRWITETGVPYPTQKPGTLNVTNSVSALRASVQDSSYANGWTYHEGIEGIQPGDVLDWAAPLAHVSLVQAVSEGKVRSIGSGNMTSNPPIVDYQPKGGGFNGAGSFRGYMRPPYAGAPAPTPPVVVPTSEETDATHVKHLAAHLNAEFPKYHTNAASDGVRGPIYWRLVQMEGRRIGIYGKGYIINGVPGPRSRYVESVLFAQHP